jgi:hypothetical protein
MDSIRLIIQIQYCDTNGVGQTPRYTTETIAVPDELYEKLKGVKYCPHIVVGAEVIAPAQEGNSHE